MLVQVTITGADDQVNPADLAAMSDEFPFVEWGVLFSQKRMGTPRYPWTSWADRLATLAAGGRQMRLAAHLCGVEARLAFEGQILTVGCAFGRVQLNGVYDPWKPVSGLAALERKLLADDRDPAFILQVRGDATQVEEVDLSGLSSRASVLVDASGGRGVAPSQWPVLPERLRGRTGFAGGITPETARRVADAIERVNGREMEFWIDMETGVRTNDVFDLARVRMCLENLAPYVVEARDRHVCHCARGAPRV